MCTTLLAVFVTVPLTSIELSIGHITGLAPTAAFAAISPRLRSTLRTNFIFLLLSLNIAHFSSRGMGAGSGLRYPAGQSVRRSGTLPLLDCRILHRFDLVDRLWQRMEQYRYKKIALLCFL